MTLETTRFDVAEYLDSEEAIAAYLDDAIQTGDMAYLRRALGNVARGRGMTEIAEKAGITRAGLYKALSETGNPSFETISAILSALGVRLTVASKDDRIEAA